MSRRESGISFAVVQVKRRPGQAKPPDPEVPLARTKERVPSRTVDETRQHRPVSPEQHPYEQHTTRRQQRASGLPHTERAGQSKYRSEVAPSYGGQFHSVPVRGRYLKAPHQCNSQTFSISTNGQTFKPALQLPHQSQPPSSFPYVRNRSSSTPASHRLSSTSTTISEMDLVHYTPKQSRTMTYAQGSINESNLTVSEILEDPRHRYPQPPTRPPPPPQRSSSYQDPPSHRLRPPHKGEESFGYRDDPKAGPFAGGSKLREDMSVLHGYTPSVRS